MEEKIELLKMISRVRAIIFDLDGTLLDTIADIADSVNAVMIRRGFPIRTDDEYKQIIGEGIERFIYNALPHDRRYPELIQACVTEMRAEYALRYQLKTKPYPEIPALLNQLTEMQIKIAVLSNKPDDFTVTMVQHLLPSWKFDPIWGQRMTMPPKPDPQSALEIARYHSVQPAECLFIGDSEIDIITARSAGMVAVAAGWGFRNPSDLKSAGADVLIMNPIALLSYLR